MARNIEIKARIDSAPDYVAKIAASALADEGPIAIVQDDTFFHCASGRLKLRSFADGTGELIFYRRQDRQGPKESFYLRVPTSAPAALGECLSAAFGQCGRVVKRRQLFLAGRTRIHVDDVRGLGSFLELEVVLQDHESAADGVREARGLMDELQITEGQLIEGAYLDLLAQAGARE